MVLYVAFGVSFCAVFTFWYVLFTASVVSHCGFDGGNYVLIARFPGHCLPFTSSLRCTCGFFSKMYMVISCLFLLIRTLG